MSHVARRYLHPYLTQRPSRRAHPDAVAVEDPGRRRQVTYAELDALSDRAARPAPPSRACAPATGSGSACAKSIDAVAAIFGILKCGAAHVPVDAGAPPARNALILNDCSVRAVVGRCLGRGGASRRAGRPSRTAGLDDARDREAAGAASLPHGAGP